MTTILLAALAAASTSTPVSAVGTGDPSLDGPALQQAFDLCSLTGRPLVLDATSKPFVIDSTVTLKPQNGKAVVGLRVTAYNKSDGSPTVWYRGTGTAVKFYGLKTSVVDGLKVQLRGSKGVGFWFATNKDFQSTGGNIVRQCVVSGNAAGQSSGFWVGPEDDNKEMGEGSNDLNSFTFEHCQVSGNSGTSVRWIEKGFWAWGGNCKDLQFLGCGASFTNGPAFLMDANPDYHPYAYIQGSQFIGCDSSHVATAFRIKGGCMAVVVGGRTEALDDPFAVEGIAGGGPGYVKLLGFCDAGQSGKVRVKAGDANNPVTVY